MNMSMNMNPNMNMNMNEGQMTTITMRPQGGCGEGVQPAEFCITPEFAEKLFRYAALEHVSVSVFFRRLIRTGLSRYEYLGGF